MTVHKLESTDAFIAFDYDGAPGTGMVRLAPKVLVDGALLRARTVTYALATFGIHQVGATAGINSKADGRDTALAAFAAEVAPMVAEGRFLPWPGNGIGAADLVALRDGDPRPADLFEREADLVAAGAVAAADAFVGGVAGTRAVVAGTGPVVDATVAALAAHGADVAAGGLDAAGDVLFVAGPPETLNHDVAATVQAAVVVPLSPLPVTARALAVLTRAGVTVVADFVSTAGPLLAAAEDAAPAARIGAAAAEVADAGPGAWLAAAERAEAFLTTWQDVLPFGRPLS